jgi:c-di-GMP-binding flagellar brake protein YcgR
MDVRAQSLTDRRSHDRFVVEPMYSGVLATPRATRSSEPLEGHVYEISLGGMRFELDEALPRESVVSVEISLPGCDGPIAVEGRVLRVFDAVDDPGPRRMVLEFETFAAGARERLSRYLGQKWLRKAPPQPVGVEDEPTCEVMIETNEAAAKASGSRKSVNAA